MPLTVNAYQMGNVVLHVRDRMTHDMVSNMTINAYDRKGLFLMQFDKTDDDLFASSWPFYAGDVVYFSAWSENYYYEVFERVIPEVASIDEDCFRLSIDMFKRCSNVTVDVLSDSGVFPAYGEDFVITVKIMLNEENTVFGMHPWIHLETGMTYTGGLIVFSSDIPLFMYDYDYLWVSASRYFYAYRFERFYSDVNNGCFVYSMAFSLYDDAKIGVIVTDTERDGQFRYFNVTTLTYYNSTLNMTGSPVVEYGYQPTPILSHGFISIDDLWVENIPPCGGVAESSNWFDELNGMLDYFVRSYLFVPVMVGLSVVFIIGYDYVKFRRKTF